MKQFVRLYLFPGGYHCGGGEGPFNMDLLTPIMQWVESDIAPEKILASHTAGSAGQGPPQGRPPSSPTGPQQPSGRMGAPGLLPPTPGPVDRTRPIFPYPEQAKYTGSGSIDSEVNFAPVSGIELPSDRLQWLGSSFYTPGYEMWCTVDANGVHCSSHRSGS